MDLGDDAEALEMAGREGDREKVDAATPGPPPPVPGPGGDLGLPEGAGITPPVSQSAPQPARSFPPGRAKDWAGKFSTFPPFPGPFPSPPQGI